MKTFTHNTPKKHLVRYETAFSTVHNVFVSIDRIIEDDEGNAILICSSGYDNEERFEGFLFRACELTNYCM